MGLWCPSTLQAHFIFMSTEIWKTIYDYPDYQISSTGKVKSTERIVLTTAGWHNDVKTRKVRERILKSHVNGNGYLFVTLRKNGKHAAINIHKLVSKEFIGKIPSGLVVNHKNGIKTDNRVENLEYCSKSRNTQHYYEIIGKRKGYVPYSHIPQIIKDISLGSNIYDIAQQYNVTRNDIAVLSKIISF